MQELSAYKRNLKPAILEEAAKCFLEKGIRAVKMDDIAKNLGISKRTLYEIYSNKEEVLVDVVNAMLQKRRVYMEEFAAKCDNVLDILFEVLRQQVKFSASTHENFFKDLNRYEVAQKIVTEHYDNQKKYSYEFFEKGVAQGYFRSEIDYKVFMEITHGLMHMLHTDPIYKNLTYSQLFSSYTSVILRGICTDKGRERFDEFVKQCS